MADDHGPNHSNFRNEEFDELFSIMKSRPDDEVRRTAIKKMLAVLEDERPWIELLHSHTPHLRPHVSCRRRG